MHGGSSRSDSEGAATRPNISLAAKQWLTPHGMGCIDSTGKLGAGGEFAKQATQWQWPSPRATDDTKGGPNQAGSKGDLMLPSAAAQWPTPNAHDGRRPGADLTSTQGGTLSRDAVVWPTPASRDYRSPNSQSYKERGGGV
jgi:hypothetical protein